MLFHDRAILDGPARITAGGHLVANARVAKANNIQDYMPSEIGHPPKADGSPYRIFRPESAVFAKDAIASAAHRPITIDHPAEDVTAANWKQLAVGDTGGEVMRDGDFLRIPVMVMDARGVEAAQKSHREFSLGYSADLNMTPGTFGEAAYDGSMTNIRVNHLALCGSARGGAELRIIDERPAPHQETGMKIKIGDAEVDATNGEAVSIAVGVLNSKLGDAASQVATLTTQLADASGKVATLTAEKVALEAKVADAAMTPEKLRDAARSYALVTGKAKALGVTVTDAMDEPAIMAAVVAAKLGDAAKGWTAEQIHSGFVVLAKDAKIADADPLRAAISGMPVNVSDAQTIYTDSRAKLKSDLSSAWKMPAQSAAA